jgi:uncharacterized protein YraI
MSATVERHRTGAGHWKRFASVVALGAALMVGAAAPAEAASPKIVSGGGTALTGPSPAYPMAGGFISGTSVIMECWTDSVWTYSPYATNRWFVVSGLGFNPYSGRAMSVRGYVPANRVIDQVDVRHC